MQNEQAVKTTARLYECRDTARRPLGDKYHERMDEYARIVRAVAKRDNCNDIFAVATVIKETAAQGMDVLMMIAAVVEMTEPSNAK